MKTVACVFGLWIGAFGAVGLLDPSGTVWLARQFVTHGHFHAIAAVRIAFGLVLISVSSTSRAPKTLRVLGGVLVILGIAAACAGLAGIERARAAIAWWTQQSPIVLRLTAVVLLALGAFVTFACAPNRRSAE